MIISLTDKIYERISKSPRCTIYTNSDFYDLGSPEAVRKSLSRLCNKDKIIRLIDGYYTIPYYIDIIDEVSYPSADELANKIANKYMWDISPYGENALNQIGLSTQVPVVCEYISDGPYREYNYLGRIIKFRHTTKRNISNYSKPIKLIIQSIKAIGKDNIDEEKIKLLSRYMNKYVKEDNILEQTKFVPVWIYNIIREVRKGSLGG